MPTLKERCSAILKQITKDAILRQGSSVETLMAFVIAEQGRSAHSSLEQSLPLCLYFPTTEDREQFIEEVRKYNPNFITKRMP